MTQKRNFSYDKERQYYRKKWPTEALGYVDLERYLTAWLDDHADKFFRGKRILDIGAGEATYTRMIAERYSPDMIVALELFYQRLLPAKRACQLPSFSAIAGDCFQMPFSSGTFDVVFGSLILHQLPDVELIAAEIGRILKPGGLYIGIEPNVKNPVILARFLFGRHSANQFLFRMTHLRQFERAGFDLGVRYFYWKIPRIRSAFAGTCIGVLLTKKNIVLSEESRAITLPIVIPGGTRANLIYRAEMSSPFPVKPPRIGEIVSADRIRGILRLLLPWLRTFGAFELLRLMAKLITRHRIVAAVIVGREVASYAWLYRFHPFDYPVDEGDCSISLVSTSTFYRGMGLAEVLVKSLMNIGVEIGHKVFFIETSSDNNRMINVIRNCGVWELVGCYLRLGRRFR